MAQSLQVLYATDNDTTFDHDYYLATHMPLVGKHMGAHIQSTNICKGLAGGPDTPAGYHVIATMTFENQGAMDAALGAAGPVLEDIANFYNGAPQMLIGEVLA
ncbi:MAG: EthD family reductase [Amylibacter sp.]